MTNVDVLDPGSLAVAGAARTGSTGVDTSLSALAGLRNLIGHVASVPDLVHAPIAVPHLGLK